MKYAKLLISIFALIAVYSCSFAYIVSNELNESTVQADSVFSNWEAAGCDTISQTVRIIDISNILPIVSFNYLTSEYDTTSFISAIPNEAIDDQNAFKALIVFISNRELNISEHIRIFIPSGIYNFSDQLVMYSNISLKGAGSNLTELRFLIRADSTSTTMTDTDCRKDAIRIEGTGLLSNQLIYKVGIENLKIIRVREGSDESTVYANVDGYEESNSRKYFGNYIAFRYANNCWVKGVESSSTVLVTSQSMP